MSVKILKIRNWMVDQTTLLLYIWLESRSQLSKITKKWYLYPIFIVKNISFGTSKTLSNKSFCQIIIWSRVIWNTMSVFRYKLLYPVDDRLRNHSFYCQLSFAQKNRSILRKIVTAIAIRVNCLWQQI